jgi:hypothetical protein
MSKAGQKTGNTPATPDAKPSGLQQMMARGDTRFSNAMSKIGDRWGFAQNPAFQSAMAKMGNSPFSAMLPKQNGAPTTTAPQAPPSAPQSGMSSPKMPPIAYGDVSGPKMPPMAMGNGGFIPAPSGSFSSATPMPTFDSQQGWQQAMGSNPQALMKKPQPVPPAGAQAPYTAFGRPSAPPLK